MYRKAAIASTIMLNVPIYITILPQNMPIIVCLTILATSCKTINLIIHEFNQKKMMNPLIRFRNGGTNCFYGNVHLYKFVWFFPLLQFSQTRFSVGCVSLHFKRHVMSKSNRHKTRLETQLRQSFVGMNYLSDEIEFA